ncbi:MAG: gluconate 2-dehydrogenase subunit 3 family protein [Pseudorhodobacter sp.]|nr:gluconate 2-dehydrogenase subunit 3 family protein [Pseudorhodobacter sp.]
MTIRFHRLRDTGPDHAGLNRRMFLMTTTMAGVTTASLLGGARIAFAGLLDDGQSAMLLRMVQDIYPHPDLLQLAHYQAVADTVVKGLEADAEQASALTDGLAKINAESQGLYGKDYIAIADADTREGLLRHFQNDGFFQGVRWTAYFGIYDNKEIWPFFGYQGSSVEQGGYIDRGFSDITFVPQGPTLEERMAEVQQ